MIVAQRNLRVSNCCYGSTTRALLSTVTTTQSVALCLHRPLPCDDSLQLLLLCAPSKAPHNQKKAPIARRSL
ncbi:hypothetical protein K523DRAFT_79748 [Schizophyllum commune Tattone D]|nr:hypothetical protein K523DRAFT_79748 [Schizophyllum commune Tattone D]